MKMICEDAVISWYSCSVFGFALKEFLGFLDLKPPPQRKGMFHFSAESLAKLKAKADEESGTTKISSFQFLSALLWRSITRAHCQPPNQGTSCRHGLQGSICNYKSTLVVIVPGNVRYTGGNWWTSEGKRGGNSLIHYYLSQKL
ncbi:unnamed protein product [Malus baccata var. baccata]